MARSDHASPGGGAAPPRRAASALARIAARGDTAKVLLHAMDAAKRAVDLPLDEAASTAADRGAPTIRVADSWTKLGNELGFLPVVDDLAVLVIEPDRETPPDDIYETVRGLASDLTKAGHDHAAIAVVALELPEDLEEAIFEKGAQLLVIKKAFFKNARDKSDRIAWLQTLMAPHGLAEDDARAVTKPPRGKDTGLYDRPNADLSDDEIDAWSRAVEQNDEAD